MLRLKGGRSWPRPGSTARLTSHWPAADFLGWAARLMLASLVSDNSWSH